MSVYSIKENMSQLGAEIKSIAIWISENASKPDVDIKTLEEKTGKRDELKKRFKMLEESLAEELKSEQKNLGGAVVGTLNPSIALKEAKGAYYKSLITGEGKEEAKANLSKAYAGLGAIEADSADNGYGDKLLPTSLSNEIVTEPYEENSLRTVEKVTNITGLSVPKLGFEIDDEDLADVVDFETAKEIKTTGDKVDFGRYQTRISAKVSSTVMRGSNLAIAGEVEKALRSGLALKEKIRAFAVNPDTTHKHMSFYANDIKYVNGTDMLKAIINAYGDLSDMFAGNAKVMMRRVDYTSMIIGLANSSESLFGKKPEDVIGIPVVFNDRAVTPIVGNFQYAQTNYDIDAEVESDKNIEKGMYVFVLTAWFDHQILLKSAFRLARIGTVPTVATATITGTAKVGETLTAGVTYSSGSPTPILSYQWKIANTANGTYSDIADAVNATYAPVAGDVGKFIKVQVTATGSATGNALSSATSAVAAAD